MFDRYVRYSDDVEEIGEHENEIADKIVAAMSKGSDAVAKRIGRTVRNSHAKAHGLVEADLQVNSDLPEELRQGLFRDPQRYRAIVRLAHAPGEPLDDSRVSSPRGLALKVLDVDGETLHGEPTQDWLLNTGETFIARNAATFLAEITQTEASAPLPEGVKAAASATSRATNAALNAVGLNSAVLDFYGHPKLNPLSETYFSQVPFRYGDYIAKLRARPVSALEPDEEVAVDSPDGLREIVTGELAEHGAEFAIEVQLCTNLHDMPVENAHAIWSQEESPYREVARLSIPRQSADPSSRERDENRLSFNPAHSLAAHRPLGSVQRARLKVYEVMARKRRDEQGVPIGEPGARESAPA